MGMMMIIMITTVIMIMINCHLASCIENLNFCLLVFEIHLVRVNGSCETENSVNFISHLCHYEKC